MKKIAMIGMVVLLAVFLMGAGVEDEPTPDFPQAAPEDLTDEITEEITEEPLPEEKSNGEDGEAIGNEDQEGIDQEDTDQEDTDPEDIENQGEDNEKVGKTHGKVVYSALGDSIVKGYTCDQSELKPYPERIKDRIRKEDQETVKLVLTAKVGLATPKLNEGPLSNDKVLTKLQDSELITLTIGSNDLMDEFKRQCKEILGQEDNYRSLDDAIHVLQENIKQHPALVFKVIGAIGNWDYEAFEQNWEETMTTLNTDRKSGSTIVVTNIYNPVTALKLPKFINSTVDKVISEMNDIIEEHAEEYDYEIVELFDSEITDHVQADGLHPDAKGQQLIADAVYEEWKRTVDGAAETEPGQETATDLDPAKYNPGNEFDTAVLLVILTLITLLAGKIGRHHI